ARITGRGMEVVADWTKVLPHDFPASPTQNPTWVYGSNENFVLNPGFEDAVDDPVLKNPGGEDGNDDDGNAEGWGASGDDLDSITAILDSLFARTGDWYIEVAASDNHSGMTQSIPVTPNREYHIQAYVKDIAAAGELAVHGMARIAFDDRNIYLNGRHLRANPETVSVAARICASRALRKDDLVSMRGSDCGIELLKWLIMHGAFDLNGDK
ncbi:MAG: hypothetical protein IIC12_05345, partial [Proteobacteria bacterium]|nr:hypothetical protein [Pseudomonadota bacterium]